MAAAGLVPEFLLLLELSCLQTRKAMVQDQLLLLSSFLNFPDDILHNDVSFHVVSITLQHVT